MEFYLFFIQLTTSLALAQLLVGDGTPGIQNRKTTKNQKFALHPCSPVIFQALRKIFTKYETFKNRLVVGLVRPSKKALTKANV